MGTIDVFAKWDLEHSMWINNPDIEQHGRSFAIANYEPIINSNEKTNYIIFTHGSRVEDHSKDYKSIEDKKVGIKNIIDYYAQKNGNYDIKLFLMDADAPIIEEAKLFAQYIEHLASLPTTNSINIIGLSKCCIMNFYVPRFFINPTTSSKVNIYNVAGPYDGTKLASPLVFYPEVKQVLLSKIKNERLATSIYNELIKVYEGISSNSHMDYDIAIPGGVPENKRHLYDESFIRNVFCDENVNAIKGIASFHNFLTGIDDKTLREAILTANFTGIGLCVLNDLFFDKKSDGMIYVSSQQKVDDVVGIKSHKLTSAHHDVASNPRVLKDILSTVHEAIEEYDEKTQYQKRRLN